MTEAKDKHQKVIDLVNIYYKWLKKSLERFFPNDDTHRLQLMNSGLLTILTEASKALI